VIQLIERAAEGVELLSLHAANPQRYPYLLESRALQTGQEGWDILFAFPAETLEAGQVDLFSALDRCWRAQQPAAATAGQGATLPFRGGWFLFLDYELAHQVEPVLSKAHPPPESIGFATRIPAALLLNRQQGRLFLVAEEPEQLQAMQSDLQHSAPPDNTPLHFGSVTEEEPQQFLDSVERIKRYIVEGDVFQVNLSRQWQAEAGSSLQPWQLYRQLCSTNPAPFAGLVVRGETAIISSSPERLVEVREGIAQTRPIAGTHPRGRSEAEDQRLSQRLLAHPKEQAEHIMLIDLERNDLGRVSQPGSVEVDELMVLESYAHVHHIVSNVRGRLREGTTPGAVIRALFPGGTITGCPKVRCMEIIDELESTPRGAYTGSFGYLNHDGSMDLNILIRTLMLQQGRVTLRAGAGIVHDSVPQRELEETRAKAKGMLMALGAAR
jgi:anthranilate synthase component 1